VLVSRFRCDSEESARRLVNAVRVAGLDTRLWPPRGPGEGWRVTVPAELVPTAANLEALRDEMEAATRRAGAVYEVCEPLPEAP
jgi:hypothetical protein